MRTNVSGGLRVVGVSPDGTRVHQVGLDHGSHPEHVLLRAGWRVESPWAATLSTDGALELAYTVTQLSGIPQLERQEAERDPDVPADARPEPYQRVAAYAVVTSERGLLLTQFSGRTNRADSWGLPGGGLDPGESPEDGVHREVWEETDQRIVLGDLLEVQSQHWIGRSPSLGLEDFHAIRIVYRATCPEPRDVVIHDVGGTTSDARWVPFDTLAEYPLSTSWTHLPDMLLSRP